MNRRFLTLLFILTTIAASILPVSASACGGFVAINGERIFHSVYCEQLEHGNLDKMRWFDTAQKAENAGLKICEECSDYSAWDFDSSFCNTYWATDDPLLLTAMELSLEYGHVIGSENAAEEYNWYYESGYEKGLEDGQELAKYNYEVKASSESATRSENKDSVFDFLGAIALYGFFGYLAWNVFGLISVSIREKLNKK